MNAVLLTPFALDCIAAAKERSKKIAALQRRALSAGDRRDGDEVDRIEAELYRLTGDARYAPYDPDEEG